MVRLNEEVVFPVPVVDPGGIWVGLDSANITGGGAGRGRVGEGGRLVR